MQLFWSTFYSCKKCYLIENVDEYIFLILIKFNISVLFSSSYPFYWSLESYYIKKKWDINIYPKYFMAFNQLSHSNNTLLRKTACIQGQLEFAKMSFTPHFSLKTRNQKMKVIAFIVFYRHRWIKLILKVRLNGKKSVRKINFYFFSRI